MKTKSLVLIGVLIIALAAMAMPVMAESTLNDDTAVYGTLAKTVTITAASDTKEITLTPGSETSITTTLDVSENCAGTLKAVDTLAATDKTGSPGYMADYLTGTYTATHLNSRIKVSGTTADPFTAAAEATDLSGAKDIYTFTTGGANAALGITFKQTTALTDTVLDGGHTYRIPITFTIACT